MKDGNWIGLHKNVKFWLPYKGRYNEIEALISYTIDVDNNKVASISAYAGLWQWSRTKVRKFIKDIYLPEGHFKNRGKNSLKTVSGQGVVIKINNLQELQDRIKTDKRHFYNPNPNKKEKERFFLPESIPTILWQDYVDMRIKIKKPMTIKAKQLAVKKLLRLKNDGHSPAKVLEQSILYSWQGLFPLKEKDNTSWQYE
jgi:hypothetical protein